MWETKLEKSTDEPAKESREMAPGYFRFAR